VRRGQLRCAGAGDAAADGLRDGVCPDLHLADKISAAEFSAAKCWAERASDYSSVSIASAAADHVTRRGRRPDGQSRL
jgi:hypothetical protein